MQINLPLHSFARIFPSSQTTLVRVVTAKTQTSLVFARLLAALTSSNLLTLGIVKIKFSSALAYSQLCLFALCSVLTPSPFRHSPLKSGRVCSGFEIWLLSLFEGRCRLADGGEKVLRATICCAHCRNFVFSSLLSPLITLRVLEPAFARCKNSNKFGFRSLTRRFDFVEPARARHSKNKFFLCARLFAALPLCSLLCTLYSVLFVQTNYAIA